MLPFKVRDTTEFLAEQLNEGKLRLKHADTGPVVFHDPCQLVHKHYLPEPSRELMAALGLDLHELT